MNRITSSLWRCFIILNVATTLCAWAQDGIYADFQTSMGDFSCKLDYVTAPKAVANFIGLTTGEKAWLETKTGHVLNQPFYDGLTFHRVISGFMVQGGSRDGTGSDGPGYAFPDESSPTARFSSFGVLAMANSGPQSNGGQYFITVAPTTWLNDLHTIFGQLSSGSNVVYAISRVATVNDKPVTNVVVNKVSIRRVGTAAQAFNINAQNLPVVTNAPLAATLKNGALDLAIASRPNADNLLYSTTNYVNWTLDRLGIDGASPITNITRAISVSETQRLYTLARVQYPSATLTPKSLLGRRFIETLTNVGVITNNFDMQGSGTYVFGSSSGTISQYTWTQEPWDYGRLMIYYSGLVPFQLRLHFTNAVSGTLTGTAYTSPSASSVSGSFKLQ